MLCREFSVIVPHRVRKTKINNHFILLKRECTSGNMSDTEIAEVGFPGGLLSVLNQGSNSKSRRDET